MAVQSGISQTARAFSVFLALVPVLNLYGSPIPRVTLAEVGLAIFLVLAVMVKLFSGRQSPRVNWLPVLFVLGLVAISAVALLSMTEVGDSWQAPLRWGKMLLWACSVSLSGAVLFVPEVTFRCMRKVALLGSVYLILQYATWYGRGVVLPSVWMQDVFPPWQIAYTNVAYLAENFQQVFFRPGSFFGEPAYYAYYVITVIVLTLALRPEGIHRLGDRVSIVLLAVGVLLSTSTTGMYLLVFVAVAYGVLRLRASVQRAERGHVGCLMPAGIVGGGALLISGGGFPGMSSTLQRVAEKPLSWAHSSRLGSSYDLFGSLDGLRAWVGVGIGNEDVIVGASRFYNDVTLLFLGTGILGLIWFVWYGFMLLSRTGRYMRMLVLVYLATCFFEQHLYSSFAYVSVSFMLYGRCRFSAHQPHPRMFGA